jgi:hypothetical protein
VINFIEVELCSRLGELNSSCVDYFEKEGPELLKLLESEIVI